MSNGGGFWRAGTRSAFSWATGSSSEPSKPGNSTNVAIGGSSPIQRGNSKKQQQAANDKRTISSDSNNSKNSSSAFENFQNITEDAWDAGDISLEDKNKQDNAINKSSATSPARSSFVRPQNNDHLLAVQTAAKLVIEQHSSSSSKNINSNNNNQTTEEKGSESRDSIQNSDSQPIQTQPTSSSNSPNSKKSSSAVPDENNSSKATGDNIITNSESTEKQDESLENSTESSISTLTRVNSLNLPQLTPKERARLDKFTQLLSHKQLEMQQLRKSAWSGVPALKRAQVWRLLCGYEPSSLDRRRTALNRKRNEYKALIDRYFEPRNDPEHSHTFRQIHIDIPRTHPGIELFQLRQVQEMLERLLFIWAIRHPASGYVQGINDLATPFMVVFILDELLDGDLGKIKSLGQPDTGTEKLDEDIQWSIEADTFWCLTRLLDTIQDHFTFAQPGIQRQVQALEDIVKRVDGQLHEHLTGNQVEYLQFAFRWMNNLLMREIPLRCTIRLWDAYLAEQDGFASLHLFACAAFLLYWKQILLQQTDFQGILMLLQSLPTSSWTDDEIDLILAEAYQLKYMYGDTPAHYSTGQSYSSYN